MANWYHPDDIDRISTRPSHRNGATCASPEDVIQALKKAFTTGGLRRIPKHPGHRDIILALICLKMRRRHPYTEPELNQYLREVLKTMRSDVDHVTCRRYLVDLGFVRRNRAGTRYLLDYAKPVSCLSAEAVERAEALMFELLDGTRGE